MLRQFVKKQSQNTAVQFILPRTSSLRKFRARDRETLNRKIRIFERIVRSTDIARCTEWLQNKGWTEAKRLFSKPLSLLLFCKNDQARSI